MISGATAPIVRGGTEMLLFCKAPWFRTEQQIKKGTRTKDNESWWAATIANKSLNKKKRTKIEGGKATTNLVSFARNSQTGRFHYAPKPFELK